MQVTLIMRTSFLNDLLAQAMGKEKNGRVRMMGVGVCPSLVLKDNSNRGPRQMLPIKILEEHLYGVCPFIDIKFCYHFNICWNIVCRIQKMQIVLHLNELEVEELEEI